MALTLLISAAATPLLAAVFLVVAAKLLRRSRDEAQPALAFFAAFWAGVGAYGMAEGAWMLAHLAGHAPFPLALFVLHLKIGAIVGGFWGLVCYLLAIRGASHRDLIGVGIAYFVIFLGTETFYSWRGPLAQESGTWGMRLLYARDDTQPWWTLLTLVLFVPPLLASGAYAMLLRHTADPALRYRIALTSASLMLFFLPVFLGWRAGGYAWWGGVEKLLSALMAAGVVLALWPPPRVRERLARAPTLTRWDREAALRKRAHELI